MNLLRAELIKFRSTASPWWLLGIALASAVGMAVLTGSYYEDIADSAAFANEDDLLANYFPQVYSSLPLLLLWILTVVCCTGEYRQGTIRSAFVMRPWRWDIYIGKTIFFLLMTAVAAIIIMFVAFFVLWSTSGADYFQPWSPTFLRSAGRNLLYTMIGVLVMVGLSFLLRNAAGTITLVVAWILVVESLVSIIPRIGDTMTKWMPFTSGQSWASPNAFTTAFSAPWNLLWYLIVALVVWLAGLVVLSKRDA